MPPQWKHPRFSSRTDLQELQTQMKKAAVVKFSLCVCRPCVLSISVNDAFLFHSFSASLFCMICNGAGCVGSFTWCFTTARHHQVQQKFRRCRPKTDKTARNRYDMLVLHGVEWDCSRLYGVLSMACKNFTSNLPWEQCYAQDTIHPLSFSRTQISTTMTCLLVCEFKVPFKIIASNCIIQYPNWHTAWIRGKRVGLFVEIFRDTLISLRSCVVADCYIMLHSILSTSNWRPVQGKEVAKMATELLKCEASQMLMMRKEEAVHRKTRVTLQVGL